MAADQVVYLFNGVLSSEFFIHHRCNFFTAAAFVDLHAKQKENERQLQQIKDAILKAPASDTLIQMLMDNETTRDKLAEAEKKEILKQRPKISRSDLCEWLSKLSTGDCESPSFRKQLVNVFLDKVFLNDDGTAVMSLNLGTTAPKEVTVEIANEALAKSSTLTLMAGIERFELPK